MKRILVALDASPRAPKVLAAAGRLAELASASLVLYRAIGIPPELPADLFRVTDRSLEQILRANAVNDLQQLAKAIPEARVETIATALATPWDGICRAAREYAADLVVIGSHGYSTIDRVLGTTAAKVVNHIDRNVMVVRAPL
jgi:nucleotide-binding universal stress UspA family protein